MGSKLELAVDERAVSASEVRRLRREGIVPANMYGHNQSSVPLQVDGKVLERLLERGGSKGILLLKIGDQPAVQALIKKVDYNPISSKPTHVEFYRVSATQMLKTRVRLHFVNEAAGSLRGMVVQRSLNEVMVESAPADLPNAIEVDLSGLRELGDMIRVRDLVVSPAVMIVTDPNDMVAGIQQTGAAEKTETAEKKLAVAASTP